MRIGRYDREFSRRHFMSQLARGSIATGVLAPLWPLIAKGGDSAAAYPDELRSIEDYTKGKLKAGDEISAANVDIVADLLDPIKQTQIREMGRRLKLTVSTTDVSRLMPVPYLEATLRNKGLARFDDAGNVVTRDGDPWIGGNPFPDPANGVEVFAGHTLSWGRHDAVVYPFRTYSLSASGEIRYTYEGAWAEMAPVGRVVMSPKPYWPGHEDKLRYQSVMYSHPANVAGTSYLNIWPYDHSSFPELYGYLPHFRRVREFPTDQRFEPLVPGSNLYLSDAWAAGDPLHTWGEYTIVDRGPVLAGVSGAWNPEDPDWAHSTHGGQNGLTFWDTTVELVPEAIVVEAKPTGFPRAPVGKKRVWFDARTMLPIGMVTYDRRGDLFRSFDGAYGVYESPDKTVMAGDYPYWSWGHVHAFDIQSRAMTRLEQVRQVRGGHELWVNDPDIYDRYLTRSALAGRGL